MPKALTALSSYLVAGQSNARRKRFKIKQQLASGIAPIQSKQQTKAQAVINARTLRKRCPQLARQHDAQMGIGLA
ncbi:hypothetical protein PPUJ20028_29220 [Pseudomonas putida]|uniref:Uncharacterized protein n=1 Tax=Pseudomonas putida TaxID=303 RepID=A0AA37RGI9_PSEPU|nr:hypothetical protein PPUJ20028_29220 [Pseudomonas putida]GLO36823.1 hypothetical protein PPUN14671_36590 [Pseudomonas putida]